MLSVPHMIVVFVIVLVVFGPQKLPELARGLGKLMAEFRKASTDFKSAFEEEMRDLERQAREVERKKQALLASASATLNQPVTLATPSGSETQAAAMPLAPAESETRATEAGVLTPAPVPEAVPRSTDAVESQTHAAGGGVSSSASRADETPAGTPLDPAHDQQQPA
jgi:sec-independent protein translocase protein TatB